MTIDDLYAYDGALRKGKSLSMEIAAFDEGTLTVFAGYCLGEHNAFPVASLVLDRSAAQAVLARLDGGERQYLRSLMHKTNIDFGCGSIGLIDIYRALDAIEEDVAGFMLGNDVCFALDTLGVAL